MGAREQLLLRCGDRFAVANGKLPELDAGFELQDSIAPICRAGESLAGAPGVLTLRLLDQGSNLNVFECESAPAVGEWRRLDAVGEFAPRDAAEALRSGGGAPWYAAHFHARLLEFARRALSERGVVLEGPAEQVRVSPLSCVYRFPCVGVDHWVKATRPEAFVPEGSVMSALHAVCPEVVPAPVAIADGLALFEDFGERMQQDTPHAVVASAAAAHARLQLRADSVLGMPGLQSWRLADLRRDLEASRPWLGDDAQALLGRVEDLANRLAAFGIGDHLVHGDFYWGNIALRDSRPLIFDWSDAGVGHPFFDPLETFASPDPERRERIGEAFLGVWREAVDADVDAAWPVAQRLAAAHHLARNTRLLSYLEPWERPTCEGGRRFWARLALEALASG